MKITLYHTYFLNSKKNNNCVLLYNKFICEFTGRNDPQSNTANKPLSHCFYLSSASTCCFFYYAFLSMTSPTQQIFPDNWHNNTFRWCFNKSILWWLFHIPGHKILFHPQSTDRHRCHRLLGGFLWLLWRSQREFLYGGYGKKIYKNLLFTKKTDGFLFLQFSTLLILIFILELAAGIAGYALRNATASYLSTTLLNSMEQYNVANDTTYMWDLIQKEVSLLLTINNIHTSKNWWNYEKPQNR